MKSDVKLKKSQIVCEFQVTDNFATVIVMTPNEARNFKAKLEAALKALSRGDED